MSIWQAFCLSNTRTLSSELWTLNLKLWAFDRHFVCQMSRTLSSELWTLSENLGFELCSELNGIYIYIYIFNLRLWIIFFLFFVSMQGVQGAIREGPEPIPELKNIKIVKKINFFCIFLYKNTKKTL